MFGVQKIYINFFLCDKIIKRENWEFIDKFNSEIILTFKFIFWKQATLDFAKIATCAKKVVFHGTKLKFFQARAKRHMHARVPRKYHQVSSLSVLHIHFGWWDYISNKRKIEFFQFCENRQNIRRNTDFYDFGKIENFQFFTG